MKLHHSKYKANYKDYILENLDVDKGTSREGRIRYLFTRFYKEYGFEVQRLGKLKAIAEWLSGLAIDIPFYKGEQIEFAKAMGSVDSELTEKQEDRIIEGYWDFMARMVLLLEEEINF
jgi:hypothetical protein